MLNMSEYNGTETIRLIIPTPVPDMNKSASLRALNQSYELLLYTITNQGVTFTARGGSLRAFD